MAKFHVNAKGVPAPCKATKGNCPYGGSTGTENHFNSIEEAQEFANKQNEEQFGLLSNGNNDTIDMTVDEEAMDYLFSEARDNHGYTDVGVHSISLDEEELEYAAEDEAEYLQSLRDAIEENCPEFLEKEQATLIPDYNAEAYFSHHVINSHTEEYEDSSHYEAMVEEVKKHDPSKISFGDIEPEFEEELARYAAKKTLENSKLTINGKKFFIGEYDDHNWAKDYFENNK